MKQGGERLYRNDNNHFVDVTAKAGIYSSAIGFGLGATVADVNNDGWPDIYVSNDFFEKDYLYINQHDGTFKEMIEASTGHISLASMGSDVMDINNDGWLDIFTTDMLPEGDQRLKTTTRFDDYDQNNAKLHNDFHHQLEKNCLQLNNGDGTFSEIADLAGVQATDWSWGALGFDFDNDGWKDIFVSNGISKDLTDQDFLNYFGNDATRRQVERHGFNYRDFLDKMPVTPISNYAFVNQRDLTFKNESRNLGLAMPSFSNGAAYGDLDGDGDLDLVVNNENQEAFVYRNQTSEKKRAHFIKINLQGEGLNTSGLGARVELYTAGMKQVLEQMPTRGFESSVEPVLNFGIGLHTRVDSLSIRWPDGKLQSLTGLRADTAIVLKQRDARLPKPSKPELIKPLFENVTDAVISGNIMHRENDFVDYYHEILIPKMLSREGPKLAIADVNGDGLSDFFIGAASGDTAKLFLQDAAGHFSPSRQNAFEQDKNNEDVGAQFFDADGDGDMDLVVVSGGNDQQLSALYGFPRLYLNDGKGHFTRSVRSLPLISVNGSCVETGDADGDGKPDIFIGARSVPGSYGRKPSSLLLKNMGNGIFSDATVHLCPELTSMGMVTDAKWADIDGDGVQELIIAGDWMPVTIFKYGSGKMNRMEALPSSAGWWNCLTVADVNGDGKPDLIAGNLGLNSKIKADSAHPANLYVGDFDQNGITECIPVYYKSDGKPYPFNLYRDMMAQMPFLKKKFLKQREYAGLPIESVLSAQQLGAAEKLQVDQAATCVFLNQGGGRFIMQPLPLRAQFSPVYAALVTDLNGDGKQDIFLGGNFFALKPETGHYDASYGVSLMGDAGGFQYQGPAASGLFMRGEIRDVKTIATRHGSYIIVARNNETLQIFRKTP